MRTGSALRKSLAGLLSLAALVAAGCATAGFRDRERGCANPTFSPDGEWILFSSGDEVLVCRPDGSDLRNLTRHPAADRSPVWSADGKSVLFASDRDGNWEICSVQRDGGGLKNLTQNPAADLYPRPSPAGDRILFFRGTDPVQGRLAGNAPATVYDKTFLMVASADGSDARPLASGHSALWSPDGAWICFAREDRVRVIRSDGSGERTLTSGWPLCWTADGRAVLFSGLPMGATAPWSIYRVSLDASEEWPVLRSAGAIQPREARHAWTPSGDQLALSVNGRLAGKKATSGVVILDPAGKILRDLRVPDPGRWYDETLSWSPDGKSIVFAWHDGAAGGIFTMKADGGDVKRIVGDDAPLPGLEKPADRR